MKSGKEMVIHGSLPREQDYRFSAKFSFPAPGQLSGASSLSRGKIPEKKTRVKGELRRSGNQEIRVQDTRISGDQVRITTWSG